MQRSISLESKQTTCRLPSYSPKSGRSYHEILPYLSNKERVVIAPDYPGHGESSLPPSDPHAVTIEDFSEAIWCVIDDLVGEAPLHLIGHLTQDDGFC